MVVPTQVHAEFALLCVHGMFVMCLVITFYLSFLLRHKMGAASVAGLLTRWLYSSFALGLGGGGRSEVSVCGRLPWENDEQVGGGAEFSWLPGAGGGGVASGGSCNPAAAGGAGGAALYLHVHGVLELEGTIAMDGASGINPPKGDCTYSNQYGGGGGAGGSVKVVCGQLRGNGTISANGGQGNFGSGGGGGRVSVHVLQPGENETAAWRLPGAVPPAFQGWTGILEARGGSFYKWDSSSNKAQNGGAGVVYRQLGLASSLTGAVSGDSDDSSSSSHNASSRLLPVAHLLIATEGVSVPATPLVLPWRDRKRVV